MGQSHHKPQPNWFFVHAAGNTFGSHEKFLKKMKKSGAVRVKAYEYSSAVVIFCPIFTRFDYDVGAALYDARVRGWNRIILVAMHRTFDKGYALPQYRYLNDPAVVLLVDVLFNEKKGLLNCRQNDDARRMVCERLGLYQRFERERSTNCFPDMDDWSWTDD